MATQETQVLDKIIDTSRRKMLTLGVASIAGMAVAAATSKSTPVQAASYSDLDILNFALNLEYLEANFYYLAAFGCTIDKPNTAAIAAGAPSAGIPITGPVGTAGTVTTTGSISTGTPFTTITAGSYATETAIEEGKHVLFLQSAIGSSSYVAQPSIDLSVGVNGTNAWTTLATAALGATTGAAFNPYLNDNFFLIGAYVFEDVGVTAYHGAASLLTGTTTTLPAAAGILAVEAYHAGLVRTSITLIDATTTPSPGLTALTTGISNLRAALALAASPTTLAPVSTSNPANPYDTNPDDFGVATFTTPTGIGSASAGVTATRIVDADVTNVVAFSRNTNQVLNIVTGGGKVTGTTVNATATGVFFPKGMNAGANGFK
jgi:hypothetical protein